MKSIKFLKAAIGYKVDEVATLHTDLASTLIRLGVALEYEKQPELEKMASIPARIITKMSKVTK